MDLSLNDLYWHKSDVVFYCYTSKREGLKEKQEPKDCKFCNANSIEFEIHFIFQYPLYADHRKMLFDEVCKLYPGLKIIDFNCQLRIILNDSIALDLLVIFRTRTHWEIHSKFT